MGGLGDFIDCSALLCILCFVFERNYCFLTISSPTYVWNVGLYFGTEYHIQ